MADIDTLLGLNAGPKANMRALSSALRGQAQLGDVLSLSTIDQVSDLGRSQRKRALGAAQQGGALRETRREREAAQRRWQGGQDLSREKFDYRKGQDTKAFDKFGDPLTYTNDQGEIITVRQRAGDGALFTRGEDGKYGEADLRGWWPYKAPGSSGGGSGGGYRSGAIKKDGYGNAVRGGADGIEFADGTPWSVEDAYARKMQRGTAETSVEGDIKGAKARAAKGAERLADLTTDFDKTQAAMGQINRAINALGSGAETGPIASRLPSLRSSTIELESAQDDLAMEKISSHTFGSLSEAEAQWLRRVAIPDRMDEADLQPYLEWVRTGMERIQDANEYRKQRLTAGEDVVPAEVKRILSQDGFDITVPPTLEAYRKRGGVVPNRPIRVPADVWDELSAAEKRNVAGALR